MSNNEIEIIKVFRQLTPEYQADLLHLVRLASTAENSVQKPIGCTTGTIVNNKNLRRPK